MLRHIVPIMRTIRLELKFTHSCSCRMVNIAGTISSHKTEALEMSDWLQNCCWSSPAQWFLVPSPKVLVTIMTALGVFTRHPDSNSSNYWIADCYFATGPREQSYSLFIVPRDSWRYWLLWAPPQDTQAPTPEITEDWLTANLLLAFASTVIPGFSSHGTEDHILLYGGSGSLQTLSEPSISIRFVLI
jgi:hypothetical protein